MNLPKFNSDFHGSSNGRYRQTLLTRETIKDSHWTPLIKIMVDYLIIVPSLLLIAPLLILLSLLIYVDSPGPILHRTPALGKNGRIFHAYTFRTRRLNRAFDKAVEAKVTYSLPRTAVGRLLQQCGLDELPQLINVLKGDMSLVGPRLITTAELEKYGRTEDILLSVRPGLTGLWQLSGRYGLTHQDRVRVEINYICNWSLWLDVKILMLTPVAVWKMKYPQE